MKKIIKKFLIALFVLLIINCTFNIEHCKAQWVQMSNGITGIGVSSLAANGTNIYAGTMGNGLFFSTNNGANWNAGNFPSGVYYYILSAGDFRETKKMI